MESLLVVSVRPYTSGSESASVTLRSDRGTIEVFCYPCQLEVGDLVRNQLTALDAEVRAAYLNDWPEIERSERAVEQLEKIGPYAYRGCGLVVDKTQGIIDVLGFFLDLGEIPSDGYVEFECLRVDL